MKVVARDIIAAPVDDIASSNGVTILEGIVKVGFFPSVRERLVSIWADPDGITIHVWGGFKVASNAGSELFAYKYLMIGSQ